MGRSIGLKEVRKTHRGFIARKVLPKVEAWDMAEFEKGIKKLCTRSFIYNDRASNETKIFYL